MQGTPFDLPERLEALAPSVAGQGFLLPDFDSGSVFLRDAEGKLLRPTWNTTELSRGEDPRRALPPGRYTVVGYRIVAPDADGNDWFLATATRDIAPIEIHPGQETRLELGSTVVLKFAAGKKPKGRWVRLGVLDAHGGGVSLYKNGAKIRFGYALFAGDGTELQSGAIDYG